MSALERVWACDTITGLRLNVVPVLDFSWAHCFNDGSEGQATIQVRDPAVKKLDLASLIAERSRTLVYEVDGAVVAAGIIQGTSYNFDSGSLRVDHADLWSILADRLAINHGAPQVVADKLVYSSLSLGTIAKRLVQEAIAPGGWYALPIAFPADVAGTSSRTFYGYNLQTIPDALKEIIESSGGPDIEFAPRWDASGALEWVMRINPGSANTWDFNLDAVKPTASGLTASSDSANFTNNAFVTGEGTEKKMLYRSNPSADHSLPAAEAPTPFKGVTSLGVLGDLAVERSRALSVPTRQFSMSVFKDGSPGVTELSLGDTVRIYAAVDPWMPPGWSSHRLIKFSGGTGPEVKLEFQPTGA